MRCWTLALLAALTGSAVALPPLSGSARIAAPSAAQSRPLPDEETFLEAARENMARANREQYRYAYKERRTQLHTNPFGRIGTGEVRLYEVTPGPDPSVYYRQLLERDGKPVTDSKVERQERRIRRDGPSAVDDTVATLRFALDRRERVNGRDMIVVRFEPRPGGNPQTREGRMAKSFEGEIWIDEQAREVVRAEAVAVDDLSYGFGIVARVNEGATATLTRAPLGDGIWLPTSVRITGEGRALLFRRLNIDHVIEWFDYRQEIPNPKTQIPNPNVPWAVGSWELTRRLPSTRPARDRS